MSEFDLIDKYCRGVGPKHRSTIIDVGDDAAVIRPNPNKDLAVSTDTMVEGVHFLTNTEPSHLAYKILSVNCSDMAAMGAEPKYATLSLTLPSLDATWLEPFSIALKQQAERYKIQLIGGDTTRGKLSLSCTIIGLLDPSKVISRDGAKVGDDVFVSNAVGDAALGLACLQGELTLPENHRLAAESAHHRPQARVALGMGLLNIANSGLDVSDGLIADLGHVCAQSGVAMQIDVAQLPISEAYQYYLDHGGNHDFALYGGDDYELAFTCKADRRGEVQALSEDLGLSLTKIGSVIDDQPKLDKKVILVDDGKPLPSSDVPGFNHFT